MKLKTLQVRFFNDVGVRAYKDLLEHMNAQNELLHVDELLEDNGYSTVVGTGVDIDVVDFKDKEACGKYFSDFFRKHSPMFVAEGINPVGHRGLMTWLDAAWAPYVLKGSNGKFRVGELTRHIYGFNPRARYRHILGGPFEIYDRLWLRPDLACIFLKSGITNNSETYEQLASRPQIVSDIAALELIGKLYGIPPPGSELPGAGQNDQISGGLRRFCTVHSQLELNFDLRAMQPTEIAGLLPEEFSLWLRKL